VVGSPWINPLLNIEMKRWEYCLSSSKTRKMDSCYLVKDNMNLLNLLGEE
jgi:hypothetical protein